MRIVYVRESTYEHLFTEKLHKLIFVDGDGNNRRRREFRNVNFRVFIFELIIHDFNLA